MTNSCVDMEDRWAGAQGSLSAVYGFPAFEIRLTLKGDLKDAKGCCVSFKSFCRMFGFFVRRNGYVLISE